MNHSIRVLHLEDDPRDAELVQQKLKTEGLSCEIVWADRKERFESALEREAFDLVLTDYSLPGYDGISALRRVREKQPDLPVIVISGTLGEDEAVECLKAGAIDYVLKQRLQRLGAAVRAALDRNRLEREAREAEKGLRESEERFRQLAENIRDVFFLTSAEGNKILYVSPAYEAIWGRTCESLYAQPQSWIDAIHPDHREHALWNFQEGTKSGRFDYQYRIVRPDGEIRWIRTRGYPIKDASGTLVRIASIGVDISERKAAEEKIERLNRVYAVLSGINSLIVRVRDRKELFNGACGIAVEHGNFGIAWAGRFHPATQEVTAIAWAGIDAEIVAKSMSSVRAGTPHQEGVTGRAVREKKPVFNNDITAEPDIGSVRRQEVIRRGYRSAIALPLLVDGAAIGALTLYAKEPNFFDEEELKLLTELAGDISFALENIIRQQKLAKLSRVRAVSSEITSAIVRSRSKQELFNEACRIAVEYGNFGIAWIGLYDAGAGTVTPVASDGIDTAEHIRNFVADVRDERSLGGGELVRAIRKKAAIFSNDLSANPDAGGIRRQEAVRRGYRSHIVLPLTTEGQVAATLGLFTKEPEFFTEEEVKVLEEMASDISLALQSIARQEKIEKLSRTRAVSSGINATLVRVRDRQELFRESCRIAVEDGQFPFAWIGVLDPATQDVVPIAWAGDGAQELTRIKSSARADDTQRGQGAVGRAIRERRPVLNNDLAVHGFGGPRLKEILKLGFRSQLTLPLFDDQTVVGTLTMYAGEPNFFDEEELKLLTELAGDISFALENITRQQKLDELSRIRAVSSEINAAIVRIGEREPLLKETCRIAVEHGKFELLWIGLLEQEKQRIQPVAWAGFSSEIAHEVTWASLSRPGGTLAEVVRTRKVAVRNNFDTEGSARTLRREAVKKGYRSTVCVPFMVDDSVVAAMILFAPGAGFFDKEELALLNEVAADVSFALQAIEKQEKLNYLAYYNALTGLPNRILLQDYLGRVVRRAKEEGTKATVLMCDVKRFRHINETFGRQGGDALLRELGKRLRQLWPAPDNLGHIAADCFAGVLNIRDAAEIAHLIEKPLAAALSLPFEIDGKELRISLTAGIAVFPGDGEDADALFKNAEAALKNAKAAGERYLFYHPQMNAAVAATLSLENRLHRALDNEQFVLHYQPKIDLASGRISGLEALIRWNDPETGLIPPMQFIALLEETGMILEAGRWAMHKALQDYSEWCSQGLQSPRIAVNVSIVQLRQKNFVDVVRNAIAGGVAGSHGLDLEITESLLMEDIEGNIEKLRMLNDMGINIVIDDFGTGYSSLGYLARLPVNALKIDRSFIITMASNADNMSIVSTIISLAHSLSLKVIAEGVETEEQSKFLRLLKCDEIQGYLFSKPLPASELVALLREGREL